MNQVSSISELNPATASVLRRFATRRRRLVWVRAIAMGLLTLAISLAGLMIADTVWLLPTSVRILLSCVAYLLTAATVVWMTARFLRLDDVRDIARQLESVEPRLRENLLSAVELASEDSSFDSADFRDRLQRVVAFRAAGMNVDALLPLEMVRSWLTAAVCVSLLGFFLLFVPPLQFGRRMIRVMVPTMTIQRASLTQVDIISPDPASGFGASGDATAIIARVSNLRERDWGIWDHGDRVSLQFRSNDSAIREVSMVARGSESGDRYSANLMLGDSPLQYRIAAGDAVTLWNTLTPLARPYAIDFRKQYQFPAYTRLPDLTVQEDHGDVEALEGSTVTMTITFDQPVVDAIITMGRQQKKVGLVPIDAVKPGGPAKLFEATLPVHHSQQYQVDAVSVHSNLSNPFGRLHTITPVIDVPPTVRWDDSMSKTSVVSPTDVLSLSAEIIDDLPIDRLVQKTVVNGRDLPMVPIELEPDQRHHSVSTTWDLTQLDKPLSLGDRVRMHWVAIDRQGQMFDSEPLKFLIAEPGFDVDRHDSLTQLHQIVSSIRDWYSKLDRQPAPASITAATQALVRVKQALSSWTSDAETKSPIVLASLQQIGVALLDWKTLAEENSSSDVPDQRQVQAPSSDRLAQWIQQSASAMLSHAVTVAAVEDAMAIQQSLGKLPPVQALGTSDRRKRLLAVVASRLRDVETLVQSHSDLLLDSTAEHWKQWANWTRDWNAEKWATLEQAEFDAFLIELDRQVRRGMLDQQLIATLPENVRELNRSTRTIDSMIRSLSDVESLQNRVEGEADMATGHPDSDLRYIADLNLLARALQAIGEEGKLSAYPEIAPAFRILTAAHLIQQGRRQLARLAAAERRGHDSAGARIEHPAVLERYSVAMEHAIELVRSSERTQGFAVDDSIVEKIATTQVGQDFAAARERMSRRRWSSDDVISGNHALRRMVKTLDQSMRLLQPTIANARRVIEQFAPSIAQLARQAAEQASAGEGTDAADEVIDALNDFANNIDLLSEAQREMSRDADSAAAQIQRSKSQADDPALSDAQREAAIGALADALQRTADHFQNAADGNDVSQSRQPLRSGEQDAALTQMLDDRSRRLEPLAKASGKSPRELLQQLEEQLRRNESLQDALDELTADMEQAASTDLERWIQEQDEIQYRLQNADPQIGERMRRANMDLNAALQSIQSVQDSLIDGAIRASDWANAIQTKTDLQAAKQTITQAMAPLAGLNPATNTIDTLANAASDSRSGLQDAVAALRPVMDQANDAMGENLHQSERGRFQQQQSMERFQREVRRQQLDANRKAEAFWIEQRKAAKERAIAARRNRSSDLRDAAIQTQQFAEARLQEVDVEQRKLERQKMAKLDQPNPAAQLMREMLGQAEQAIRQIEQQLAAIALQVNAPEPMLVAADDATRLAQRQGELSQNLQVTGRDLTRAARHQQRLGKTGPAKQLNASASGIIQGAKKASDNATRDLESVSDDLGRATDANQQMASAGEAMAAAKQKLSDRSATESDVSQTARQFAETLDELDQAIAAENENASADASGSGGENENVDSGEGDGADADRSQTAASVSPTLQLALGSFSQEMARLRQQQADATAGESNAALQPSGQVKSSPPGSDSGQADSGQATPGDLPGGPSVSIDSVDLRGDDWGQLRSRIEDANSSASRVMIPAQYRQEIEAYFRTIAEEGTRQRRSPRP